MINGYQVNVTSIPSGENSPLYRACAPHGDGMSAEIAILSPDPANVPVSFQKPQGAWHEPGGLDHAADQLTSQPVRQ